MGIIVAPNRIELSSFPEGFMPDAPEADVPLNGLPDVLNLIPDRVTDGLKVRPGYEEFDEIDPAGFDSTGTVAHFLFYFEAIFDSARHKYLIAILTTGVDDVADNEAFCVLDLDDMAGGWDAKGTFQAPHAGYEHWGGAASNIWYGGTGGIPMYSWNPDGDVFTADASAPNLKTWETNPGSYSDNTTERPEDFAWKEGQATEYTNNKSYTAARGIRHATWKDGTHYRKGEKVSRWAAHTPASDAYWKSATCKVSHTAVTADNAPFTGTDADDFWTEIVLSAPVGDDGDTSDDWFFMPRASESIIGTFHGYRLWLRRHDQDSWAWVQYSAPFKPEKGVDIADLVFDPADWAVASDIDGDGAGWIPMRQGDGDGIRAFKTFGSYLLIFKRWSTWTVVGVNEATWNVRNVDPDIGTLGGRSLAVHGGLVYFVSPDGGLYVTDGTRIEAAQGGEKVRQYLNDAIDGQLATDDTDNWLPTMTTFQDFLYLSLTSDPDAPSTIIYHPTTGSWWPTDLPILDAAVGRIEGEQQFWFTGASMNDGVKPKVYRLITDPDDDGYGEDPGNTPIAYHARSPWIQFGTTRNERRLRKAWAMQMAVDTESVDINIYSNYDLTAPLTTVTRAFTRDPAFAEYVEGLVGPTNTMYSIGIEVDGSTATPLIFYGFGVDTEPHRFGRFHRGG